MSNPLPDLHAKLLYGSAFKAPSPDAAARHPRGRRRRGGQPAARAAARAHAGAPGGLGAAGSFFSLSSDVAYSVLSNKTEFVQQGISQVARNVARAATLSWETLAELRYRDWSGRT